MPRLSIFLSILFPLLLTAQESDSAKIKVQEARWDTLKYRKYDYVLIVGFYQQHRTFSNEFIQEINKDKVDKDTSFRSTHTYLAESNLMSGLVFNYDKFQISLGTRSQPRQESAGKGYTRTFNIGLNFGDNRWVSENYYRRFIGFYNKNTPSFDSTFKETKKYFLQPGMSSSMFMTRLMYFSNYEKFSYKSGFGCNYRQLRSAATWIVGGSYSVYTLRNDSSLFPSDARGLFNDYASMKGFRSFNFSFNAGAAGTLVLFKAWFVSGYFTLGPEQQWRDYDLGTHHRRISAISWSGIGRFSFGLNLRKFYFLISSTNDYNLFNSPGKFKFKAECVTFNATLGWRFHTGTPGWYQKFMNSNFYKLF